LDEVRFRLIFGVLSAAGMVFVGISGWSLKTQFETQALAVHTAQVQLDAIHQVQTQITTQVTVPKPQQ
jgi:uncharacterized membrane protein